MTYLILPILLLFSGSVMAGQLSDQLRQGGYVLFFTPAEENGAKGNPIKGMNCPVDDKLTQTGWRQALTLGMGLREKGVLTEEVATDLSCRSRYTAHLAFGADKTRFMKGLNGDCGDKAVEKRLAILLAETSDWSGWNRAIVIRSCHSSAVIKTDCPLGPADGVVLKEGKVVACLPFRQVENWARQAELYDWNSFN